MISSKITLLCACLLSCASVSAQTWVQKKSLPDTVFGRHHPVTFAINGYGYVLGGSASQSPYLSDFYRYDPVADEWTKLPDFPGPARSYSYAIVYEGKAYMGFGFGLTSDMSDMWVYDPADGSWTEKALCPGDGRGHPAYMEADGKIYVGLGQGATGNLKDFWAYDIAADTWAAMPDLPSQSRHHPFYFSIGSMVYAGFGHGSQSVGGTTIYRDLYRFDPSANDWERMDDFPGEQRVAGTQFSLNGKGYVLSGEGQDHYYLEEGEFWEYDPGTDKWTELPPMPGSGRWAPGSFVIGNTVYATGGTALLLDNTSENQRDLWAYTFASSSGTGSPLAINTLQVYPNPVQHRVFATGEWNADTRFQVLHIDGRVLRTGFYSSSTGIEVQTLPAGTYQLLLENKGQQQIGTFVKQ